jgi:parallel beta-helix repeat protein
MLTGWMVVLLFLFSSAHATVWYVHPDSTLNSIQAGLNFCSTDDTVLVGPGTYYENIVWPTTQGIDLISEYGPDTTIIDGNSSDQVMRIITEVDSMTVIHGFTIQHGYTTYDGGGIGCFGSSPTITGNTITDNTADYGGGIGCYKVSSVITGNIISTNTAILSGGGIYCTYGCYPTIANNIITENTAQRGGGISCRSSSGAEPIIMGNTITSNTATQYGGGIDCHRWSLPNITVNTITGNTAQGGGGIHCSYHSSPMITANTIAANIAIQYGGGIACDSSSPIITANTITANCSTGVYCKENSSPLINYNNITDNTGYGVCNLDTNIMVNAEYNWWGNSTGPYHPDFNPGGLGDSVSDDIDFIPWLNEPYGVEEHKISQTVFTILQVSPNPFTKMTNIKFQVPSSKNQVTMSIYDATGRLVRQWDYSTIRLSDQISWYGRDNSSKQLPNGVYFLKFEAGDHTETKKLLLIR